MGLLFPPWPIGNHEVPASYFIGSWNCLLQVLFEIAFNRHGQVCLLLSTYLMMATDDLQRGLSNWMLRK